MLAVGFLLLPFIMLKKFSSMPGGKRGLGLLVCFSHRWVLGCALLSIEPFTWLFSFILLITAYCICDFRCQASFAVPGETLLDRDM